MYTIKENIKQEIVIKKSKFIALLIKIKDQKEINQTIENIKKSYPNATHYCYAYCLGTQKKASDDHEPNNTAGVPMLSVLEKNQLNYVLCVVVRYFGGIKLGAGGLIRAYQKSVVSCIQHTKLVKLEKGYQIILRFPYNQEKQFTQILKNEIVLNKTFTDEIAITLLISKETLKTLQTQTKNITIQKETLIEKES